MFMLYKLMRLLNLSACHSLVRLQVAGRFFIIIQGILTKDLDTPLFLVLPAPINKL